MTAWALSLRREQARALAKLHHLADVQVADGNDLIWARGTATDEEVDALAARVPLSRFFEVVQGNRLRPRGRLLPTDQLPELTWVSLSQWLSIRVPPSVLPGALAHSPHLRLVPRTERDPREMEEELLVCNVSEFREFLLTVPAHRMRPLQFVVNDYTAEILVRGQPLPSIPGERFVLRNGIATPVGYVWSPAVSVHVVRSWLGLSSGKIALWRADGGISEVSENAFSSASRSAGRAL